ncbi:hypothetical protein Poly24_34350 [Rosistilla carotiformis]|uniref:Uncharacterized protein n=1 Tax=Rosistilla carotiformis TaxID=2528017 RepID=A0A518JW04_9BACT|nr:hypothetical protein [Rosistilla carotiformis]QDV69718.1 hypothetical protein Poly24_34350 [Rosistilla carotiformis]
MRFLSAHQRCEFHSPRGTLNSDLHSATASWFATACWLEATYWFATASWFAAVVLLENLAEQTAQAALLLRSTARVDSASWFATASWFAAVDGFATTSWFATASWLKAASWFAAVVLLENLAEQAAQAALLLRGTAWVNATYWLATDWFATASWFEATYWLTRIARAVATAAFTEQFVQTTKGLNVGGTCTDECNGQESW